MENKLTNKLISRVNTIKVNIKFGEQFKRVYENDPDFCQTIDDSIKEQKNYQCQLKKLKKALLTANNDQNNLRTLRQAIATLQEPDERLNRTLKLIKEHRENMMSNNNDNDNVRISDYDNAVEYVANINEQECINIVVIGSRGSGKSMFLNAIFGIDHFHERAVPTDEKECTVKPRAYTLRDFGDQGTTINTNNGNLRSILSEKFVMWDFPGVGTCNFPMSEYREMIPLLPVDAYVYLYCSPFTEHDHELVNLISDKIVFLVRTKADLVFDVVEEQEKICNSGISDSTLVAQTIAQNWEICKNRSKINDDSLIIRNKQFYFISCLNEYREDYDFPRLMDDILEKLPDEKVYFLMSCLQVRTHSSFMKKSAMLKSHVPNWVRILVFLIDLGRVPTFVQFLISKFIITRSAFGFEFSFDDVNVLDFLVNSDELASNVREELLDMFNARRTLDLASVIYGVPVDVKNFVRQSKRALDKNGKLAFLLDACLKNLIDNCLADALHHISHI